MDSTQTKVIFRKFRNGGDIIAVFPRIAANVNGYLCESYMHVGQHGAASPDIVQGLTVLATPKEYAALERELIGLGYILKIAKRFRYTDQQCRMQQTKNRK